MTGTTFSHTIQSDLIFSGDLNLSAEFFDKGVYLTISDSSGFTDGVYTPEQLRDLSKWLTAIADNFELK